MSDKLKDTILIVDDERANLLALNGILSQEYAVTLAKSGEQAIALAVEHKPDLILLDVLMPVMDGFEVMKALKASEETASTPVIFVTGLDSEADEEKGFQLGAVDYITKPFRPAIVKVRVATHMKIIRHIRMNEKLGLVDALTDIPNRRSFNDRLSLEWKRAERDKTSLSLLAFDLDKFKMYNDRYGHPQGDELLKVVAKILAAAARRPSDLAARLGGEEFMLLLPATSLEAALHVAEQIREAVEGTVVPTASGEPTSATVSIGAASVTPEPGQLSETLVARADENLYKAKNSGRNKVVA